MGYQYHISYLEAIGELRACLSATAGSTLIARHAGIRQPSPAAAISANDAAVSVTERLKDVKEA